MSELPIVSVTDLVNALREVVETALPACTVVGEISNCRRAPAGHWYLTLKDEQSEISAVIWRGTAQRLRFEPRDGMKCLATGSLQVYTVRGTCQFIISALIPQGVGDLEMAFRQLKEKLAAEGLFETSRKRPIPVFPRRIALVTSSTSAAVRDMIQVITRRWPPARIVVVPVRVQGETAAAEIAAALRRVHLIPDVDVVITGRGGGSLEDLWCFNTEVVARAIAECRIPVIAAVGHETDVSIADLVADRRALTPSEAGEFVVPSAQEIQESLRGTLLRMKQRLRERLEHARLRLLALEGRSVLQRPMNLIDQRRQECDGLAERALRSLQKRLDSRRSDLAAIAASLQALSPLHVLSRGYSLTMNANGQVLRSASDVVAGDTLMTKLASGTILSRVEQNVVHSE